MLPKFTQKISLSFTFSPIDLIYRTTKSEYQQKFLILIENLEPDHRIPVTLVNTNHLKYKQKKKNKNEDQLSCGKEMVRRF